MWKCRCFTDWQPCSPQLDTTRKPFSSFSAAAAVSRTRDNGILTGSTDYAEAGQCVVTNLTRDTLATNGDQVITTGLGGVYPADMLVGNIDRIEPDASGKSVMAVIDPGAEILSLTHVFIITDF